MFEVEKPHRFHYEPRFYNPEKEKWEALKSKYADKENAQENIVVETPCSDSAEKEADADLEYFERRVRDIDREAKEKSSKLSWKDLFRKREMPTFNYQSRLNLNSSEPDSTNIPTVDETLADKYRQSKRQIKIRRRFDISDSEYMKPISGTKIIVYGMIVVLLITLIIKF